jgi:hypothetical protein
VPDDSAVDDYELWLDDLLDPEAHGDGWEYGGRRRRRGGGGWTPGPTVPCPEHSDWHEFPADIRGIRVPLMPLPGGRLYFWSGGNLFQVRPEDVPVVVYLLETGDGRAKMHGIRIRCIGSVGGGVFSALRWIAEGLATLGLDEIFENMAPAMEEALWNGLVDLGFALVAGEDVSPEQLVRAVLDVAVSTLVPVAAVGAAVAARGVMRQVTRARLAKYVERVLERRGVVPSKELLERELDALERRIAARGSPSVQAPATPPPAGGGRADPSPRAPPGTAAPGAGPRTGQGEPRPPPSGGGGEVRPAGSAPPAGAGPAAAPAGPAPASTATPPPSRAPEATTPPPTEAPPGGASPTRPSGRVEEGDAVGMRTGGPPPPGSVEPWLKGQKPIPERARADWADYQRRVCGNDKYSLPDGPGEVIDADGIRPSTGTVLESKFVGDPATTPYRINSGLPEHVRDSINAKTVDEFRRYAGVFRSGRTPLRELEVITNHPVAVPYLEGLMRRFGIPGRVVVRP